MYDMKHYIKFRYMIWNINRKTFLLGLDIWWWNINRKDRFRLIDIYDETLIEKH